MIILTAAQANQVRGLTALGHALAPRPFVPSGASNAALNGKFGLPNACLVDEFHANRKPVLQACLFIADAQIHEGTPGPNPGDPPVGSDWETDPVITAKYAYNSSWPPGQIIVIN